MSTFQAVNTSLTAPDPLPGRTGDETTPTTPRPHSRFFTEARGVEEARGEDPSAKTPTRNTFATGLAGQRPLPSSPFTPSRDLSETPSIKSEPSLQNSHRSTQSALSTQDVQMGEVEDDDKDDSDNDSVSSDAARPSKKKKGQRFFCVDFPPCSLSFTRTEHLARHIRKHTGERPFQCHCSRRFSRLDNLRQHAQTVHVNEDIPAESLAATGTRFQRQIRTDRVRPPGSRSRANTLGSTGAHSRGHSRNLSSSSIASTMSSMSVLQSPDVRRRPPPLAMASDSGARARLTLSTMEIYNPPLMGSPGPQIVEYDTQSNAPATPSSASFTVGASSPVRFGSVMQSPGSNTSRPVSWAGPPPPGRRLSTSSNGNPFSGPPGQAPPPPMVSLPSSAAPNFSGQSSAYASPTASNFSESTRESNADTDWRRRTWHPGTYTGPRPATSGLGYHQTPDAPRPSYTSQPAASQTRLPGIESFDHAPPLPLLARHQPPPMQMEAPSRPLTYHTPHEYGPSRGHQKRSSISWEIDRLRIGSPITQREPWGQYAGSSGQPNSGRPTTAPHGYFSSQRQPMGAPQPIQVPGMGSPRTSQEQPATPRKNKRQAWYNGPLAQPQRVLQRTSPEDSSSSEGIPTPGTTSEYHPAILNSNGFVEVQAVGAPAEEEYKSTRPVSIMERPHPLHGQQSAQHQQFHSHASSGATLGPQRELETNSATFGHPMSPNNPHDMRRLEALVAVATGEHQSVENPS